MKVVLADAVSVVKPGGVVNSYLPHQNFRDWEKELDE